LTISHEKNTFQTIACMINRVIQHNLFDGLNVIMVGLNFYAKPNVQQSPFLFFLFLMPI